MDIDVLPRAMCPYYTLSRPYSFPTLPTLSCLLSANIKFLGAFRSGRVAGRSLHDSVVGCGHGQAGQSAAASTYDRLTSLLAITGVTARPLSGGEFLSAGVGRRETSSVFMSAARHLLWERRRSCETVEGVEEMGEEKGRKREEKMENVRVTTLVYENADTWRCCIFVLLHFIAFPPV